MKPIVTLVKFLFQFVIYGYYLCGVWTIILLAFASAKALNKFVLSQYPESSYPKVTEYIIFIGVIFFASVLIEVIHQQYKNYTK